MQSNILLKLLCSLPSILIFLYFIPFFGVCLILLRFIVYSYKKISTSMSLIFIGILILIPQMANHISNTVKINLDNIPYLNHIINSDIYTNLIKYSHLLLWVGIIFLIISFVLKNVFNQLENFIKSYIVAKEQQNMEVSRKNDMEIKLKQEKAKNTHVVHCPYCGANNILSENIGHCQFCRRKIEYKE